LKYADLIEAAQILECRHQPSELHVVSDAEEKTHGQDECNCTFHEVRSIQERRKQGSNQRNPRYNRTRKRGDVDKKYENIPHYNPSIAMNIEIRQAIMEQPSADSKCPLTPWMTANTIQTIAKNTSMKFQTFG
jgi:hypothetical protein